jgi:cellulose synthase/poly-beta-1,6-N-acetylglucosamine synthase-like glycosyltransferase
VPRLTVVLPARDEADRLPAALAGLYGQAGVAFRVVVVDDASTDGTADTAHAWLATPGAPPGEVIATPPLPAGWAGKSWAAWTGARSADTELLLFLDTDTVLDPGALAALVSEADRTGADLVSGVTRYTMRSPVERLLMPGFPMLLFGFLPLGLLARTGGRPARLAFAYGPLMLVRRAAYLAVDGHRAIAASPREDVDLARTFARAGRRVALLHGADLGATRHYPSARAIAGAWRRILFAYSGESLPTSLVTIAGFFLAWTLPMLLPVAGVLGGDPLLLGGGAVALALMLAARVLLDATQRMPRGGVLWHPLTAPLTGLLQIAGLLVDLLGPQRTWRGRTLPTDTRRTTSDTSAGAPITKGIP